MRVSMSLKVENQRTLQIEVTQFYICLKTNQMPRLASCNHSCLYWQKNA